LCWYFAIVLAIACFAGMYWGLHRHSALFYGSYWLAKTRSLAEAPTTFRNSAVPTTDSTCQGRLAGLRTKNARKVNQGKWLSADDINALIATSDDLRGKVFASIEGNRLRLQASLPIGGILGRPGYYFNGDVIIEVNGAQSLESPQFSRITINGEQVPTDFLNWNIAPGKLREYLFRSAERVRDRHDRDTRWPK